MRSTLHPLARIGAIAASLAVAAGVLVVGPASAAVSNATITDNGDGTVSVSWSGTPAGQMNLGICSATASLCYAGPPPVPMWTKQNISSGLSVIAGMTVTPAAGTTGTTLPNGTYRFELMEGSTNVATLASAVIGTGGGGGSSSTAAAPKPVVVSLDLSVAADAGVVCKDGSSVAGYIGQWVTLPGQSDCSLSSRPGARLLGWSTSASFPVAIAQRQADHGWGAYQLTDEAGNVTAVFIPAGHDAYVSGSNTLHPIWSA